MSVFEKINQRHYDEKGGLFTFCDDAFKELGIEDNPKRFLVWGKACALGNGYVEVLLHMKCLVELIK